MELPKYFLKLHEVCGTHEGGQTGSLWYACVYLFLGFTIKVRFIFLEGFGRTCYYFPIRSGAEAIIFLT